MLRKKILKVCILIVSILTICTCIRICYKIRTSPYRNEEGEKLKPVMEYAVDNNGSFEVSLILEDIDDASEIGISLRRKQDARWHKQTSEEKKYEYRFSDEQLQEMNQIVEKAVDYLNNIDNLEGEYKTVLIQFSIHHGSAKPLSTACYIKQDDNKYYFDYVCCRDASADLSDLYHMKSVKSLIYEKGITHIDSTDKDFEKFSELTNLKSIKLYANVPEEELIAFAKLMKEICPDCKIYNKEDEEVVAE